MPNADNPTLALALTLTLNPNTNTNPNTNPNRNPPILASKKVKVTAYLCAFEARAVVEHPGVSVSVSVSASVSVSVRVRVSIARSRNFPGDQGQKDLG